MTAIKIIGISIAILIAGIVLFYGAISGIFVIDYYAPSSDRLRTDTDLYMKENYPNIKYKIVKFRHPTVSDYYLVLVTDENNRNYKFDVHYDWYGKGKDRVIETEQEIN